jgi:hypothetical protein
MNIALLLLTASALAQCPGGQCPTTRPAYVEPSPVVVPWQPLANPVANVQAESYRWEQDPKCFDYWYLYLGARHVGTLHPQPNGYRAKLAKGWGEPNDAPPVPLPGGAANAREATVETSTPLIGDSLPTGVVSDKIHEAPTYSKSGKPITRQEAFGELGFGGPNLPDDGKLLRVVAVMPDDAACRGFLTSIQANPDYVRLKDKLVVTAYQADAWQVKGVGYPQGVHVVRPTLAGRGMVLATVPVGTAPDKVIEAVRRVDPQFDPAKVPNPLAPPLIEPDKEPKKKPLTLQSAKEWAEANPLIVIALALGGWYFYTTNRKVT